LFRNSNDTKTLSMAFLSSPGVPPTVRLPVTSASAVPALVAASMSTTICGCASALKKSAERRCLSRLPCLVSSDAASMTRRPLPVPSAAIAPVPESREKLPRTVARPQMHPTDRRATLVELPAGGAAQAERELGPRLNAMAELSASLTPSEREQFSAILTRLTEAMRAGEARC
jgi:hypothetical protein